MGKNHRGKGLKEYSNKARGECPLCKRTGIKLLYEHKTDDKTIKICKICKHQITNAA